MLLSKGAIEGSEERDKRRETTEPEPELAENLNWRTACVAANPVEIERRRKERETTGPEPEPKRAENLNW
jgi:hypothetical protein